MNYFKKKYKPKRKEDNFHFDDICEVLIDLREYDVKYSARVCIDYDIRVSFWYEVKISKGFVANIEKIPDMLEKPDFSILAYDIETTKEQLRFPDALLNQIMLISYVIDEEFFLIVNREICSKDIKSFRYSPLPDISSEVNIFNEKDEKSSLLKFFNHIR